MNCKVGQFMLVGACVIQSQKNLTEVIFVKNWKLSINCLSVSENFTYGMSTC